MFGNKSVLVSRLLNPNGNSCSQAAQTPMLSSSLTKLASLLLSSSVVVERVSLSRASFLSACAIPRFHTQAGTASLLTFVSPSSHESEYLTLSRDFRDARRNRISDKDGTTSAAVLALSLFLSISSLRRYVSRAQRRNG